MLKHEGRATGVMGAPSFRRGAGSEYLGGLLTTRGERRVPGNYLQH